VYTMHHNKNISVSNQMVQRVCLTFYSIYTGFIAYATSLDPKGSSLDPDQLVHWLFAF
jgi:hypothetical protein